MSAKRRKKTFLYKSLYLILVSTVILAILSFDFVRDVSSKSQSYVSDNLMGIFGNLLAIQIYEYMGITIYLLPILLISFYPILFFDKKKVWIKKSAGLVLIIVTTGYVIALLNVGEETYSGILSHFLSDFTEKLFGFVGCILFVISFIVISFSLLLDRKIHEIISYSEKLKAVLPFDWLREKATKLFLSLRSTKTKKTVLMLEDKQLNIPVETTNKKKSNHESEKQELHVPETHEEREKMAGEEQQTQHKKHGIQYEDRNESAVIVNASNKFTNKHSKQKQIIQPDASSLAKSNDNNLSEDQTTNTIIDKLESTMEDFGIEAKVTGITKGPVVTCYELTPAPGIKLSKIINLQDNIALNLATSRIRIVAPLPDKSAIGIEIPNDERSPVTLGDVLDSKEFLQNNTPLPLALGKDVAGNIIVGDLTRIPHLLIAGSTGSGKSVCLNSLICGLIYANSTDEIRMMMIDPKIIELKTYNDIPQLLTPVITEPKEAVKGLKWLISEMEKRYRLFDRLGTKNIFTYNKKIEELKKDGEDELEKLKYYVLIIDEFADLLISSAKEVENLIVRLAAKARASGIHLILATQRPSVDVITGLIKANFPGRIAFQVASKIESRIIIDTNGAEKLLGRGDSLFVVPGISSPHRIQGAFVSETEVNEITDNLRNEYETNYIEDLLGEGNDNFFLEEDDEDPLFNEALEIVLEDKKTSISYLQRKLKIGYNRAARIVEMMEDKGILSSAEPGKQREILID